MVLLKKSLNHTFKIYKSKSGQVNSILDYILMFDCYFCDIKLLINIYEYGEISRIV